MAASIVEYFTGAFSKLFGGWGFDPIIADPKDQFRALEIAGYIGLMLSGAFPMVYLVNKYLAGPLKRLGERVGLEGPGAAGIGRVIAEGLSRVLLLQKQASPPPTAAPSPPEPPHDFAVVRRVIAHAESGVLEAIVDLARRELEKRQSAS